MSDGIENAIKVDGVSKTFKLPHEKQSSIKGLFVSMFRRKRTFEKQRVLQDISFEIHKGEFFGIVGRNGSGKSTLLKLLSGIYSPDAGHIAIQGTLTPFIELGVGFNPELTGRENIFLNGALLGFGRKEMEAMYDDIVAFAELDQFMDQKLKNYSSGMQVRLAFSIAVKARNDILIFDEVLAVGDEAFQRKCLDVFEKYKAEKQTIVLVTHDMEMVRRFCDRALLLNRGSIVEIGNPREVATKYSDLNISEIEKSIMSSNEKVSKHKLLKIETLDVTAKKQTSFKFGEQMIVAVDFSQLQMQEIESVGISIFKQSGEHLTGINSRTATNNLGNWKKNKKISIQFELNILPGTYSVLVEVFDRPGHATEMLGDIQFTVSPTDMTWSGLVELPHTWKKEGLIK